ncbi:MAG: hypothetical protein M1819_006586 [Sarea resinae]|nr:MAG: hypothetical protein M1819_006586 [Sarea resinae]
MAEPPRVNNPPLALSEPPPPPPPLPPQKYTHRATNALARFAQPFIYGSRPASVQTSRSDEIRREIASAAIARGPNPLSSLTTTHKTGLEIDALDISPQGTHAVLAGQKILKTVRVSDATCAEEFNLRSAIIAYASTHNTSGTTLSAKHKDQLGAVDVKWSHGRFETTIATAVANGKVVLYDINRPGVEMARLHEHNRQVHKVAFNPHQGALLLSGSQDTTVRLWDMRAMSGERGVMTCRSVHRYMGNTESVRDLKWSPTDGVEFAFGTDNGVIQRWDLRKDNAPLLKINAHSRTCNSIDWHPDGKHLVSAGADKNVKVWDFSSVNRRQKSPFQLRAPHGVLNVRWRPPCWSSETQEAGGWQSTHIVTSYEDKVDPRIHLWDFRRPHMPFREFDRYNRAPTDMLWHSQDLLWTVGKEGIFTQTDLHFVPKVLERRSLQAFDWAPDGEITFFTQVRPRHRDLSFVESPDEMLLNERGAVGSRSPTDDSVDESFLSSSFQRRHRGSEAKSMKSLGNTPPSAGNLTATAKTIIKLDDALDRSGTSKPAQMSSTGYVLGTFDVAAFIYLAERYKSKPSKKPIATLPFELDERIRRVFDQNAECASYVGFYRRSQSWKMLGLAMSRELRVRAEKNRLARFRKGLPTKKDHQEQWKPVKGSDGEKLNEPPKLNPAMRALSSRENNGKIPMLESSSNVPTPIARPLPDSPSPLTVEHEVPVLAGHDNLSLPPAIFTPSPDIRSFQNQQITTGSHTDGLASYSSQWFNSHEDVAERRAMMSSWRARPKPILSLDPPSEQQEASSFHPPFERHDSNESFPMFSASSDSQPLRSMPSSFAESSKGQELEPLPEIWEENFSLQESPDDANLKVASLGITNSSSESDLYLYDFASHHDIHEDKMEASGTIVPDEQPRKPTPVRSIEERAPHSSSSKPASPAVGSRPFMPSDYLPPTEQPPDCDVAWTASSMLSHLIEFHTGTLADAQTPAHLLLLLAPVLGPNPSIPFALAESVLATYHAHLLSLRLHKAAAQLRRLCYPTYPSVFDQGLQDVYVGLVCRQCHKRLENVKTKRSIWICERCLGAQAPCSVCRLRKPALGPERESTLWAWCQGCGHGGHEECLRAWWADESSEGGCASEGCAHDCTSGKRRDDRLRRRAEKEKKDRGAVRRDSWVVGESKAVERVRTKLGPPGGVGGETRASAEALAAAHANANASGRTSPGGRKVRLLDPTITEGK